MRLHPFGLRRAALAAVLVAGLTGPGGGALAHGWGELDAQRALAEADAVVAVAEAVQASWSPEAGAAGAAPASGPAEIAWWRWFEVRSAAEGPGGALAAIAMHAPGWLAMGTAADAVAWWTEALAELVAHAAARDVDDAARGAAADLLRRPAVDPVEAELASWLVLLPVLTDAERLALAPAFARLDALVSRVVR